MTDYSNASCKQDSAWNALCTCTNSGCTSTCAAYCQ